MADTISIIMPAFAVEKHITHFEKAISGIINQTYTDWELIIVCDGGFKTTIDWVLKVTDQYKDKRIKIYKSEKQNGPGVTRNLGFQYATGKYVTFHDSDDYSVPDRFEKLMAKMDANGIITSNVRLNILYGDSPSGFRDKRYSGEALKTLIHDRKVRAPICMASSIMTTDLFKSMGGFEKFKYSSDAIFVIKLAYLRELMGIPTIPIIDEPLMIYNRHPHSVTTKFENAYTLKKCQKAQRKPLMKIFRERYLKGEIKTGKEHKKELKRSLGIVNNFVKGQLVRLR